jgi:hypothetical protein
MTMNPIVLQDLIVPNMGVVMESNLALQFCGLGSFEFYL